MTASAYYSAQPTLSAYLLVTHIFGFFFFFFFFQADSDLPLLEGVFRWFKCCASPYVNLGTFTPVVVLSPITCTDLRNETLESEKRHRKRPCVKHLFWRHSVNSKYYLPEQIRFTFRVPWRHCKFTLIHLQNYKPNWNNGYQIWYKSHASNAGWIFNQIIPHLVKSCKSLRTTARNSTLY